MTLKSKSQTCDNTRNSPVEMDLNQPADFETAITASGFGRFNIFMLLAACPAKMATMLETAAVSYVLPSAECDLNLDLLDKGLLNAASYLGMILSAIGWGYLADKKGRKILLVWGFFLDFVFAIFSVLSQNVTQLMVSKFFGGFVICGPFAILMSYLAEFHGNKRRQQVIMITGTMGAFAAILLPVVATLVLPKTWNFNILNMKFTSWKVFLAIFGLPSLISSIVFAFFPESPKFLMSQGKNSKALNVFKTIYSINTGKCKDTYPIKELVNELPNKDTISVATIKGTLSDEVNGNMNKVNGVSSTQPSSLKALFSPPFLGLSIRVYLMNFSILLGQITLRLWSPQLFASLYEYEQISEKSTSMCTILEYNVNKTALIRNITMDGVRDKCTVVITADSYTNNVIMAVVNFFGFLIAGTLVNCVGQKRIQVIGLIIAGTCGIALYWSSSTLTTLILITIYSCMGGIALTSTVGTSISLFPTTFRTMVISLSWMFGRMGSISGNVLFPILMTLGCIPPFLMIGCAMYVGCILSAFLPNTKNIHFK